jgi:hypothetical protein
LELEKIEAQYQQEIVRKTIWRRFDIPICRCTPDVTAEQRKAIKIFELDRWMPALLSSIPQSAPNPDLRPTT